MAQSLAEDGSIAGPHHGANERIAALSLARVR